MKNIKDGKYSVLTREIGNEFTGVQTGTSFWERDLILRIILKVTF